MASGQTRSAEALLRLAVGGNEDTMNGRSRSGRAWKVFRITVSVLSLLWALPFLIFGGYLLRCWFRIHTADLYYVHFPYLGLGAASVLVGLICVALVIFAARYRSFFGLLYFVPGALGFFALVSIPELQPHEMRSMLNDSHYLSDTTAYFRVWHEEHNAFPANESEFAKALVECPAAWHRTPSKPQSQYMHRGVLLPYQLVVITHAAGPRLNQLSDRPGVIYYAVSADLQEFWVTMTGLTSDMARSATIRRVADQSDGKVALSHGDGREYPRDEKALQDYRVRVKTDASLNHTMAETLYHLGIVYSGERRSKDAEAAFRESLMIRQGLEKSHPGWYPPAIASTLNSLGDLYGDSARLKEAEVAYNDALEIRKKLAKENFEWYAPGLAQTLGSLGSLYARSERPDDAENAYTEALTLRRELMKANSTAYAPDVASTLSDLGALYRSKGQDAEATKACGEAVGILQQLAAKDPASYGSRVGTVCGQ